MVYGKKELLLFFQNDFPTSFSLLDRIFKSYQQYKLSQHINSIDEVASWACCPSENRSFNAANHDDVQGIIIYTNAAWTQERAMLVGVTQYKGSNLLLWLMNCSASSIA